MLLAENSLREFLSCLWMVYVPFATYVQHVLRAVQVAEAEGLENIKPQAKLSSEQRRDWA